MINANIKLYSFEELGMDAKQRAIEDHRNFLLSVMNYADFISGDPKYDTPEELQKAYDSEYNYILKEDTGVIESIAINDYMFFNNGVMAHVVNEIWHNKQFLYFANEKIQIA